MKTKSKILASIKKIEVKNMSHLDLSNSTFVSYTKTDSGFNLSPPNWRHIPFNDFIAEVVVPFRHVENGIEMETPVTYLLRIFSKENWVYVTTYLWFSVIGHYGYLMTIRFNKNAEKKESCYLAQTAGDVYGSEITLKKYGASIWGGACELLKVVNTRKRLTGLDSGKGLVRVNVPKKPKEVKNPKEVKEVKNDWVVDKTKPLTPYSKNDLGGTHASPREHIRMGHYRTLASGKTIFIRETVVNRNSPVGKINKEYKF